MSRPAFGSDISTAPIRRRRTHHLQSSTHDARQHVGEPQPSFPSIAGQLCKLGEWVLLEREHKLGWAIRSWQWLLCCREGDARCDVQEGLECDLGDHFSSFGERVATLQSSPCEEVLDKPCAHVIPPDVSRAKPVYAHLLQLLVDFSVVLVVLDQLDHQGSICQREQLSVLGSALSCCEELRAAFHAQLGADAEDVEGPTHDLVCPLPDIILLLAMLRK